MRSSAARRSVTSAPVPRQPMRLAALVQNRHAVLAQPARLAGAGDHLVLEVAERPVRPTVCRQPVRDALRFAGRHELFGFSARSAPVARKPDMVSTRLEMKVMRPSRSVSHTYSAAASVKSRKRVSLARSAFSAACRAASRAKLSSAKDTFRASFPSMATRSSSKKSGCSAYRCNAPTTRSMRRSGKAASARTDEARSVSIQGARRGSARMSLTTAGAPLRSASAVGPAPFRRRPDRPIRAGCARPARSSPAWATV